jgi:hypothetical protein
MLADGKLRWRVSAADRASHASAFDALVLRTDESGRPVPTDPSTRLVDAAVPHVGELADSVLTLIVHAHEGVGALIVECEAIGSDGVLKVYARASQPVSIIVRSDTGVFVTGLPGASPEASAPAT